MNKSGLLLTLFFGLVNVVKPQDVQKPKVTFERVLKCVHNLRDEYTEKDDKNLKNFLILCNVHCNILNEQDKEGKTVLMHIFECGIYSLLISIIDKIRVNLRLENNYGKTLLDLIRDHFEVEAITDSTRNDLSILMDKIKKCLTDDSLGIKHAVWNATGCALWFRDSNDEALIDEELKLFSSSNELHQLIADYV